MNHLDQSLNRLFKAAARAPREDNPALPFAVAAQTLACWRSSTALDETVFLAPLFRRAVIWAGVVMFMSIVWSRFDVRDDPADASVRAHYEVALKVLP